jgi:hypothetical protein
VMVMAVPRARAPRHQVFASLVRVETTSYHPKLKANSPNVMRRGVFDAFQNIGFIKTI